MSENSKQNPLEHGAVVLFAKDRFDSGRLADKGFSDRIGSSCFFQSSSMMCCPCFLRCQPPDLEVNINNPKIAIDPSVPLGVYWIFFETTLGALPIARSQPEILKGQWFDSSFPNFWTSQSHPFFEKKSSFKPPKTNVEPKNYPLGKGGNIS